MIVLFVFYIHVVAAVYVFTKRWQEESATEAFIAVGFMVLIFVVGWSVSTFIVKLFVEQEGFGKWFDPDAMSLLLLTILESVLYWMYFSNKKRKQKTPPSEV